MWSLGALASYSTKGIQGIGPPNGSASVFSLCSFGLQKEADSPCSVSISEMSYESFVNFCNIIEPSYYIQPTSYPSTSGSTVQETMAMSRMCSHVALVRGGSKAGTAQ